MRLFAKILLFILAMITTVWEVKSSTVVNISRNSRATTIVFTSMIGGGIFSDMKNAYSVVNGYRYANVAAKTGTKSFTYTKSAGKHLTDVVKHGVNKGELARPYMKSPLTIQEIMSTSKGIPDATFKGGFNWKVPRAFRGSQGIWKLGINPNTNVIYHFNFVY